MINALIITPEITKGMKSIGSKSLLLLKNTQLVIDYQIEQIYKICKNTDISIVIGFDSERIIDHIKSKHKNIRIIENKRYDKSNQSEDLFLYLSKMRNRRLKNLIIICSGILIREDTINLKNLSGKSKIFLLDKAKNNFNIGCADTEDTEYLFYDLSQPWSEILYFNEETIERAALILKENASHLFLFEIINKIIASGIIIKKHHISKNNVMKIMGTKDLTKAKIFI